MQIAQISRARQGLYRQAAASTRYFTSRFGVSRQNIHTFKRTNSAPIVASSFPEQIYQAYRSMTGGSSEFEVQKDEKWWDNNTVAIVTGANKGIGKAAAQILAEQGLKTIVAARDVGRGEEAVQDLKKITGSDEIYFEQLDISDQSSIKNFVDTVGRKYKKVSVLLNNAGFAYKGNVFGAKEARHTLDINFEGTRNVCEALLPLIESPGRIVNVCSMAGKQRIIKDKALLQRFQSAKEPYEVSLLADEFVSSIDNNSYQQKGWPGSMYGISKLCEATYTRILSEKLKSKDIDVNACCPGYVNTGMSSHRGIKTTAQGADTPVYLSLLARQGTTGEFFEDRKSTSF